MLTTIFALLQTRINDEKGATAVEYGLIVTLIALAIIVGATAVGTSLNGMFNDIAGRL